MGAEGLAISIGGENSSREKNKHSSQDSAAQGSWKDAYLTDEVNKLYYTNRTHLDVLQILTF